MGSFPCFPLRFLFARDSLPNKKFTGNKKKTGKSDFRAMK